MELAEKSVVGWRSSPTSKNNNRNITRDVLKDVMGQYLGVYVNTATLQSPHRLVPAQDGIFISILTC